VGVFQFVSFQDVVHGYTSFVFVMRKRIPELTSGEA
jgi:hypothetical protein